MNARGRRAMVRTENKRRRRLRWLLPTVLVVIWLVFSGQASDYGGKLGEVVKNDNAAFLPSSADATKVAGLESRFVGSEQVPGVVVYERPAGLSGADRSAVTADIAYFRSVAGVAGQPTGPIPSADGKALEVIVPLSTTGDATVLPAAVDKIRERS